MDQVTEGTHLVPEPTGHPDEHGMKRRRTWIVRSGALAIALAPACGGHGIVDRGVPSDGSQAGGRIHPEPKIGFSVVRSTELGPLKESSAGLAMMSNSWAWTTDVDATNGVDLSFPESGSMPAPLLVESEGERRFNAAHVLASCRQEPCGARWALWPNGFVADPARHRALIFYAKALEPGDSSSASEEGSRPAVRGARARI